ncbi:MAG: alpha/beta hydrolase [Candidatus Dormibacterales bacterium]
MLDLAIGIAALALIAYSALTIALCRHLFVPPRPSFLDDFTFTPWEFGADYEEVDLVTSDGVNFGAWFFRQSGSPQAVVVSGGHKGQRQSVLGIAVGLWRKGFNVVVYSYRGMPGSDRATITMGLKEVNELQSAIAFARRRIPDARIGLLGYSMGAAVSMLAAAGEPSVQALVLDSPFADLRTIIHHHVRRFTLLPGRPFTAAAGLWLRLRTGARLSECAPIEVLSALEPRPLFFIHGGADTLTPVQHSRRLYEAYRGPREIWIEQGAPHTGAYFADRSLYVERVAGFFARHLGLARTSTLRLLDEAEATGEVS